MILELTRSYFPGGTNGELFYKSKKVCSTIELPWNNNKSRVSCIPEGKYELTRRYSSKFGWHLLVRNVPDRHLILIHPANDASIELKGCIAPVTKIIAPGKGLQSRLSFEKMKSIVYPQLGIKKQFFIIIKSKTNVSMDTSLP